MLDPHPCFKYLHLSAFFLKPNLQLTTFLCWLEAFTIRALYDEDERADGVLLRAQPLQMLHVL